MTEQEAIEELKERYLTMSMCGNVDECKKNNQATSMAIAALEKQISKKPIFEIGSGVDHLKRYTCECGQGIVTRHNKGAVVKDDVPNYCPNCGQALDWSEE